MKKVYIKEEVCIGCHLCEVYCQLQHAQSTDLIKAFKRESPRPLPRLRVEENGVLSFSVRCQQCDEAPCVNACLTGAISRDSNRGMITVDEEQCTGCCTKGKAYRWKRILTWGRWRSRPLEEQRVSHEHTAWAQNGSGMSGFRLFGCPESGSRGYAGRRTGRSARL